MDFSYSGGIIAAMQRAFEVNLAARAATEGLDRVTTANLLIQERLPGIWELSVVEDLPTGMDEFTSHEFLQWIYDVAGVEDDE